MTRIALATCSKHPQWVPDEAPLIEGLSALGIEPVSLIWDEAIPSSLDEIAACVIRTTWDYSERHPDFLAWAKTLSQKIPLWNAPRILEWNADKHYLQWFQTQQLPVVPSFFVQPEALKNPSKVPTQLNEKLTLFCQQSRHNQNQNQKKHYQETQWVLKPTVSASGNDTFIFSDFDSLYQTLQNYLTQNRSMMIQPFLPTIRTHGEISVIMIEGRFAHAVLKTPSKDEFRIQEHLGGQTRAIQLTPEFIAMSEDLLTRTAVFLEEIPLYARLDFMAKTENSSQSEASGWLLSEMELIEPSLYLSHHPETGKQLAKAIQQRVKTRALVKQPVV